MNIYVGNLGFSVTEDQLRQLFEQHGQVSSASIITDKQTGESRGFGFVEMPSEDEANAAIEALNEQDMSGRPLKVNKALGKPGGGGRSGGGRSGGSRGGFGGRSGGSRRGGFGGSGGNRGGNRESRGGGRRY